MQFIVRPLIAFIAFAIGISAALYFTPLPKIQPVAYTPMLTQEAETIELVTLADLKRSPSRYLGRIVRVRAAPFTIGFIGGGISLWDPRDHGMDYVLQGNCVEHHPVCGVLRASVKDSDDGRKEFLITGRFVIPEAQFMGRKVQKVYPVLEIEQVGR
jgi:hypothetical protein